MGDPNVLGRDEFNRQVDRRDRQLSDLDARLARDMVPMPAYLADQRSNERRFTDLERDLADIRTENIRALAELDQKKASNDRVNTTDSRVTAIEQRPANMRNVLIALGGLALTLLGIVVSAYFSAKAG